MDTERDCSVSMLAANLLVLVSAGPLAAALGLAFAARWGAPELARGVWTLLDPLVLVLSVPTGIVAHELIHALAWAMFAHRPLRSIRFGVQWRSLAPYAHPRDPMPVSAYRAGAIAPAILLGFLPAALAIATGHSPLMAWSLLFTLAAGGDLVVLWLLRGVEPGRLVEDHPTRAGCRILASEPAPLDGSRRPS
jgi:hypothetical protein